MQLIETDDLRRVFSCISSLMQDRRGYLIELDSVMGDGDLGLTMSRGFSAVDDKMRTWTDRDLGKMLVTAGMVLAGSAPSTMGTLLGSGFMHGGRAVTGCEAMSVEDLSRFFAAFVEGIIIRGRSAVGEKTVLDALDPAAKSLLECSTRKSSSFAECLEKAYASSADGVERTKEMKSVHGRGAYYGASTVGKKDPGAAAGALIVQGFLEGLRSK